MKAMKTMMKSEKGAEADDGDRETQNILDQIMN